MQKNLLLAAVLMGLSSAGLADTLGDSLSGLGMTFTHTAQDYHELNTGAAYDPAVGPYLDSENGGVNSYGVQAYSFAGPVFFGGGVRFGHGDTRYDGYLVDNATGSITPAQATTGNTLIDLNTALGYRVDLSPTVALVPYGELGTRIWHRELGKGGSAGGYEEDYTHNYLGAGLHALWSPMPKLVLDAQGLVGETFFANMRTFGAVMHLGSKPLLTSAIGVDYAIRDGVHVKAAYQYERFSYGQSPWVNSDIGLIMEPASHTTRQHFTLGLAKMF